MKTTTTRLNPRGALRGLRTLAFAAVAVATAIVTTHTASAATGFNDFVFTDGSQAIVHTFPPTGCP